MTRVLAARLAAAPAVRAGAAPTALGASGIPRSRRVVLVGPMGAGKTTVGRALAEQTGLTFVDADELFGLAFGPIPAYFAAHGEPAFRREEARVIAHILQEAAPCVLACGGGAVLSPATRDMLRTSDAFVVHLRITEREALRRLGNGSGRPVLAGDPAGTWRRIQAERAALYHEVADVEIDGTGRRPGRIASRIVKEIPTPEGVTPAHDGA